MRSSRIVTSACFCMLLSLVSINALDAAQGARKAHYSKRSSLRAALKHRTANQGVNKRRKLMSSPAVTAVRTVYLNGLTSDWRSTAQGCSPCSLLDKTLAYSASTSSIYANISSWGQFALETPTAFFSSASIVDFLIRGSDMTSVSFYVQDTNYQRYSSELRFGTPGSALTTGGALNVLGSDDAGWIRMQVNLNILTPDYGIADSIPSWNRLVFKDISGSGFAIQLDQIKILSLGGASSDNSFADFELISTPVPVIPMVTLPPKTVLTVPNLPAPSLNMLSTNTSVLLQSSQFNFTSWVTVPQPSPSPVTSPRPSASPVPLPRPPSSPRPVNTTTAAKTTSPTPPVASPIPVTSPSPVLAPSPSPAPVVPGPATIVPLVKLPVLNFDKVQVASSPSRFIMKLKPEASFGTLRSICSELDGQVGGILLPSGFSAPRFSGLCLDTFDKVANITANFTDKLDWAFQSFEVNGLADLDAMRSTLSPYVEYFERDLTAATTEILATTMDATYNVRYWNLDRLDQQTSSLDGVYNPGDLTGANSHVYVVDTGVRWTHADFINRVGEGTSIVSSSAWDDNGHGTHVAGIAAGFIHGVAKNAIIHPVKVMRSDGSGAYSDIINGLGWVKNHVQRNGYKQAVVVMSLGGPRASSLNDAVEDLVRSGIMVVVAAGNNNGGDACGYSPASAPSAITVGASDRNDQLSSFSNVGGCLFMFAPGSDIVSASYSADNAEVSMSGTSMASPHVAGVVAMILQNQPGARVADVKQALDRAAPRIRFEYNSPTRLVNAQSSKLKVPVSTPTPTPSAPAPAPQPSAPSYSTPTSGFSPIQFPSFSSPVPTRPSWCDTCSFCMFC